MGFSIRSKEGKFIKIGDLDREVCHIWNVDWREKKFAAPWPLAEDQKVKLSYVERLMYSEGTNWFDSVGYSIHSAKGNSWGAVLQEYCNTFEISIKEVLQCVYNPNCYHFPYVNLILSWRKKGYAPVSTGNED